MPRYLLHTLGAVSLEGPPPIGPVTLDEPRLVALLVLLAVAGDAGLPDEELLLLLTPEATAEHGRAELSRLIAVARTWLGGDSSIVRAGAGHALAPGLLAMDVRVRRDDAATECTAFLADFKLRGSPEFRDWLAATRRRVEALSAPQGGGEWSVTAARTPAWRSRRAIGATICAVLVLATGYFITRARKVEGLADGEALLVANVQNETGDSVFDASIARAATVALQQSRRVQLYPRSRLLAIYRLMRIGNPDTALTFELAQEVAQRDRIRFVLGLRVARAGDGYRVTAQLADVSTAGGVTNANADARTKRDVIAALDEVLRATRRTMGESRRDVSERALPLPLVTTTSMEALRSFAEGSAAWSKGESALAIELWRRAVDIDTGFAMAYGALGASYYYNHNREQGEHYYGEALKRAGRLSDREHLQLESSLLQYRGNLDSAVVVSRILAMRYPNVSTWYNHGTSLMQAHRDSEAMTALRTALRYDSTHVNSYINLATSARKLGQLDQALEYYARAGQLDSQVLYRNNINDEWGGTLVVRGRYGEADSAFRRMSKGARVSDRALGFRSQGYLALWRGRPDEAVDRLRQATTAAVQSRSPLGEARDRMLTAAAHRAAGHDREASSELSKTLVLAREPAMEPFVLALVAASCMKMNRLADAEGMLALLRTRVNRTNAADVASEAYVAGLVALLRHRPDSALVFARRTAALPQQILRWTLMAEAYRLLGQTDSARAAMTRVLAERGFGTEGQEDWLRAPLVLGDMLLAVGDTAGAMQAYSRLQEQWRDAQPGLPEATIVRNRIAMLRHDHADPRTR